MPSQFSLLAIYQRGDKHIHKKIYARMYFAALSLIALHWKQPKHSSAGICISRLLHLQGSCPHSRQEDVGSNRFFLNEALLFHMGKGCLPRLHIYLIDQIYVT